MPSYLMYYFVVTHQFDELKLLVGAIDEKKGNGFVSFFQ